MDTKLKLIMVVYVYSDRYLSFRKQYVKNSSCINKICNFCKSHSTQALKSRDPRKDKKIDEKKSLLEALKIKKIFLVSTQHLTNFHLILNIQYKGFMEIFDKWEKFGAIFDYDLLNFVKLYIWFHFKHHQCMRKKTKESRRQITACKKEAKLLSMTEIVPSASAAACSAFLPV